MLRFDKRIRNGFLNVLFECFQVPIPLVWEPINVQTRVWSLIEPQISASDSRHPNQLGDRCHRAGPRGHLLLAEGQRRKGGRGVPKTQAASWLRRSQVPGSRNPGPVGAEPRGPNCGRLSRVRHAEFRSEGPKSPNRLLLRPQKCPFKAQSSQVLGPFFQIELLKACFRTHPTRITRLASRGTQPVKILLDLKRRTSASTNKQKMS